MSEHRRLNNGVVPVVGFCLAGMCWHSPDATQSGASEHGRGGATAVSRGNSRSAVGAGKPEYYYVLDRQMGFAKPSSTGPLTLSLAPFIDSTGRLYVTVAAWNVSPVPQQIPPLNLATVDLSFRDRKGVEVLVADIPPLKPRRYLVSEFSRVASMNAAVVSFELPNYREKSRGHRGMQCRASVQLRSANDEPLTKTEEMSVVSDWVKVPVDARSGSRSDL